MPDREKVIKALTECIFLHEHPDDDAGCFECPYRPDEKGTCPTMIPFLKDILELLKKQEPDHSKYEYKYDHTDCPWYWSGDLNQCPSTCSQYRDGWNDAMNYLFKGGKGYQPYKRR